MFNFTPNEDYFLALQPWEASERALLRSGDEEP